MLSELLGITVNYEGCDALMSLIVCLLGVTLPIMAWRKTPVHPGLGAASLLLLFIWWLV